MKKWYKESYFDSQNWILENFSKLNLSSDETLLLLLIDLYKKNRRQLSYEVLCDKLGYDVPRIDKIIASLVEKHYLQISTNSRGLVFDIDSIFEFDPEKYEISENGDIYDQISSIFNKMLSPTDMQKISDLVDEFGQLKFMEAVRVAEANRVLKMSYIEGVLRNENK